MHRDGAPHQEGLVMGKDKTKSDDDATGGDDGSADGSISAAEAKKIRAALKKANQEAADSRTRLKEIEDADKSASEKATSAAADAEKARDAAIARADRLEVALDKGLTKVQAKRLVGDTIEELEADADELLESFGGGSTKGEGGDGDGDSDGGGSGEGGKAGGKPASGRPKTDLKSGDGGDDEDPDIPTDEVLKKIPRL